MVHNLVFQAYLYCLPYFRKVLIYVMVLHNFGIQLDLYKVIGGLEKLQVV